MPTQAGETSLTVKVTRVAFGSTKTSVVVRRRLGPRVPIHGRLELKCSTRLRDDAPELELDADPDPDPDALDEPAPDAPELDVCAAVPVGAEPPTAR